MQKEYFYFDELMNVLNYYNIQKDFINVDKDGSLKKFDFDKFFEKGLSEDEFPDDFAEFEEHGCELDMIAVWCYDQNGLFTYWFDRTENRIEIHGEKFSMKEALTVINLVTEHLRINNEYCHNVTIAIDKERTVYAQEASDFGMWWNDFMQSYSDNIDNIDFIAIDLGITRDRSVDITLFTKDYE